MGSSGRSRCLGSIVLHLVLHVVPLDNDRRQGSSSLPLPNPLDSSELISSSSPDNDDEELPSSVSSVSGSTIDVACFLFPLDGVALCSAVFFDV